MEGQIAEFHKNSAVYPRFAACLTVVVLEITKFRPHNMRLPAHGVRETNHRERNSTRVVKLCTYKTQQYASYSLTLHFKR